VLFYLVRIKASTQTSRSHPIPKAHHEH
jgi:hypothetical protein